MRCDLQRWRGKHLQSLEHVQLTRIGEWVVLSLTSIDFLLVLTFFYIVLFLINSAFVMSLAALSFRYLSLCSVFFCLYYALHLLFDKMHYFSLLFFKDSSVIVIITIVIIILFMVCIVYIIINCLLIIDIFCCLLFVVIVNVIVISCCSCFYCYCYCCYCLLLFPNGFVGFQFLSMFWC